MFYKEILLLGIPLVFVAFIVSTQVKGKDFGNPGPGNVPVSVEKQREYTQFIQREADELIRHTGLSKKVQVSFTYAPTSKDKGGSYIMSFGAAVDCDYNGSIIPLEFDDLFAVFMFDKGKSNAMPMIGHELGHCVNQKAGVEKGNSHNRELLADQTGLDIWRKAGKNTNVYLNFWNAYDMPKTSSHPSTQLRYEMLKHYVKTGDRKVNYTFKQLKEMNK